MASSDLKSMAKAALEKNKVFFDEAMEKLADLRILVDVSCVEVYLNGGKDVFSTRFYPDTEGVSVKLQAPGSEGRIRLRQDEEQPE